MKQAVEDLKHNLRNKILHIEELLRGMNTDLKEYVEKLNAFIDGDLIISPTELGIRGTDNWGRGAFGAPRGDHVHKGVDFICVPGQSVLAPISGLIQREARPYSKGPYSGCLIASKEISIKMFYFELDKSLIGTEVEQGRIIGIAQDIRKKGYPGMTPHIHLEIDMVDPTLFLGGEKNG